MIKTMKEAVFKRPISLVWPELVRKLVTLRLGKQTVDRFGGRFSPRTRTVDKTGWTPLLRRAEGRFGTRFRIFVCPFSGPS
jgi:hypothetical protein